MVVAYVFDNFKTKSITTGMANVTLETIFYSVILAALQDKEFVEILTTKFPEFNQVTKTVNFGDLQWRTDFANVLHAKKNDYLLWFKEFTQTDPRFDGNILFYTQQIKKRLELKESTFRQGEPKIDMANKTTMEIRGPEQWRKLHTYAAKWNGDKNAATKFLADFDKNIGCGTCQGHWRQMWRETPADLSSRKNFFEWTVAVHNKVNKRIDKPIFDLTEARILYSFELAGYFDQVFIINLDRRQDRWIQVQKELEKAKWPFVTPIKFRAIDSNKVPAPNGWSSGGGAWGCMQSHRHILEQSIMNGYNRILVLEDDVIFTDNFVEKVKQFLEEVPKDWDQLMLGGQYFHDSKITKLSKNVKRVTNCQRTHAYAVQGKYMKDLYAMWCSGWGHCDHLMGPFQTDYKVYAPAEFVAGQSEGTSDISGSDNPAKFWEEPKNNRVVWFKGTKARVEEMRNKGFHGGRDRHNGMCKGILSVAHGVAEGKPKKVLVKKLKDWISMIHWECRSMRPEGVCMIWFDDDHKIPEDIIREAAGNNLEIIEE